MYSFKRRRRIPSTKRETETVKENDVHSICSFFRSKKKSLTSLLCPPLNDSFFVEWRRERDTILQSHVIYCLVLSCYFPSFSFDLPDERNWLTSWSHCIVCFDKQGWWRWRGDPFLDRKSSLSRMHVFCGRSPWHAVDFVVPSKHIKTNHHFFKMCSC